MLMVTNPLLLPPACQMIREQLEAMTPPRLPGVEDICEVIVSERVEGPEFGVDLVNDLEGQPAGQIYKEKLGMRAGETDAAVTRRPSAELAEFGRNLATALAHPGQCDTDIILTEEGPTLIEMNPRFGGHYPFSHLAGADVPKFLVDLAWSGSADLGLLEVEENRMFGKIIGFRELTREDDRSNV